MAIVRNCSIRKILLAGYYGVEIIQIGAVCRQTRLCAENRLNIYLRPEAYIEEEATNIHGIQGDI